jgi:hypothetical protein
MPKSRKTNMVRPSLRHALAGLLGLLALFAASGVAEAGIPRAFFGIQSMDQPSASELRTVGRGGVGTYRLILDRSGIERQPGVYSWGYPDAIVGDAARAGITAFVTVLGTPSFDSSHVLWPPNSAVGRARHAAFLRAAAARYGPHGTFWSEHSELKPRPVTNWQIWNEPNIAYFWLNRVNAGQYLDFVKLSRSALRAVDPHARIILAGMPDRPGTDDPGIPGRRNNVRATDFLSAYYRHGGRSTFDAAATHPYAANEYGLVAAIDRMRAVMKHHGDSRKALWVTEFGWATGGPASQFRKSTRGQAIVIKHALEVLTRRRRADHIAGALYFTLRDRPGRFNWWAPYTGLFYANDHAKRSWGTFRGFVLHAER